VPLCRFDSGLVAHAFSATRTGIEVCAMRKNALEISKPILRNPRDSAAAIVEPEPMNGSTTIPRPQGSTACTISLINACGFSDGCGASERSFFGAGPEIIRSRNGTSHDGRRRAPVLQRFRFSRTNPSQGLRKMSQGSQEHRGETDTSGNNLCAPLGLSPSAVNFAGSDLTKLPIRRNAMFLTSGIIPAKYRMPYHIK
jgi:hypothetical protein